MSSESEPPGDVPFGPNQGESIKNFLSIPETIRNEVILRSRSDFSHLKIRGISIQDVPEGSILPYGNRVMIDTKGRKFFKAPDVTKQVLTPANN